MHKVILIIGFALFAFGAAALAQSPAPADSAAVASTNTVQAAGASATVSAKPLLNANTVLTDLFLGMLLGATGQGLRSIVGLKQLEEEAAASKLSVSDLFQVRKLVISFIIGSIAGICAMLGYFASSTEPQFDVRSLLGLIAAGYAGADFIEGFVTRYLPQDKSSNSSVKTASDDPNANAAASEGLANG